MRLHTLLIVLNFLSLNAFAGSGAFKQVLGAMFSGGSGLPAIPYPQDPASQEAHQQQLQLPQDGSLEAILLRQRMLKSVAGVNSMIEYELKTLALWKTSSPEERDCLQQDWSSKVQVRDNQQLNAAYAIDRTTVPTTIQINPALWGNVSESEKLDLIQSAIDLK